MESSDPSPQTPEPEPEVPPAISGSDGSYGHPEVLVGAAFVGGFALAQIMKRFGR